MKGPTKTCFYCLNRAVSCSGSGPDGRITRKDIDSFVPPKAAPVSEAHTFILNLVAKHVSSCVIYVTSSVTVIEVLYEY